MLQEEIVITSYVSTTQTFTCILRGPVGKALALLALWVVVVAVRALGAVLRSPEGLLALALAGGGLAVTRVAVVRVGVALAG